MPEERFLSPTTVVRPVHEEAGLPFTPPPRSKCPYSRSTCLLQVTSIFWRPVRAMRRTRARPRLERILVLENHVVHLPESSLSTSRLDGLAQSGCDALRSEGSSEYARSCFPKSRCAASQPGAPSRNTGSVSRTRRIPGLARTGNVVAFATGGVTPIAHFRASAVSFWNDSALSADLPAIDSRALRIPSAPGFTAIGEQ